MFIPESAYSSTEVPSPTTTTRTTTTVFVAEVTCVMCSRLVGTAVETHWPPVNSVLIQVEGSAVLRRIALQRLRCPDCGGNTAPTEVTTRLLRRERPSIGSRINGAGSAADVAGRTASNRPSARS